MGGVSHVSGRGLSVGVHWGRGEVARGGVICSSVCDLIELLQVGENVYRLR